MKILVSAAEASADAHGAAVLKALSRKAADQGERLEVFGIGGPALQGTGLRAVVDSRELLSMGTTEVLGKLPRILRALGTISRAAKAEKPDLAVVIDYPDFHFRLAQRLKKLGVPVVYYIAPKVWVWRKSRVRALRSDFKRVLGILPFESSFYRGHGVEYRYVGNPLMDELNLEATQAEARNQLGIELNRTVLVAMPGSRPAELRAHFNVMIEAARIVSRGLRARGKIGPKDRLLVLIPLPNGTREEAISEYTRGFSDLEELEIRVTSGNAHEALLAANAGIIKSGTSTLEAALLGCPHTVIYRPSWLTGLIFKRFLAYRGPVGLVNLVSGGPVEQRTPLMTELLCEDATASRIAEDVLSLLLDKSRQERAKKGFEALREKLKVSGESPATRAAAEIWEVFLESRK